MKSWTYLNWESGKLALKESNILLSSFLKRIFESYHSLAKVRKIDWQFQADLPANLAVQADSNKLEKMLNNLLSNAIKYTPSGGKVSFYTHYDATKQHFLFEVADTGSGIPKKEQDKFLTVIIKLKMLLRLFKEGLVLV